MRRGRARSQLFSTQPSNFPTSSLDFATTARAPARPLPRHKLQVLDRLLSKTGCSASITGSFLCDCGGGCALVDHWSTGPRSDRIVTSKKGAGLGEDGLGLAGLLGRGKSRGRRRFDKVFVFVLLRPCLPFFLARGSESFLDHAVGDRGEGWSGRDGNYGMWQTSLTTSLVSRLLRYYLSFRS